MQTSRALLQVVSDPRSMAKDFISDHEETDGSSSTSQRRIIIVSNLLPLHAEKDAETLKWSFTEDEDSPLSQLKNVISPDCEVIYVGSLNAEVEESEQEEISERLLDEFKCLPTFLPQDIRQKYYHDFCKHYLWPTFHSLPPITPECGKRFDRELWQAYVIANRLFADKVVEVINPEEDFVWVHDYHLMVLPTFLRKRIHSIRLGFFLHSPFPAVELYKTLAVRDELVKGLLNSDVLGFHTFAYARHFLSCCSRLLGAEYEYEEGRITIDYYGRSVRVMVLPVGIDFRALENVLNLPSTLEKMKEIRDKFQGKKLIIGVDDIDLFKGIGLKLRAFEKLLHRHLEMRGKVVLVQILNPERSSGLDTEAVKNDMYSTFRRINEVYGEPQYEPVILIDRRVPRFEKVAYYAAAECCFVNAVKDGLNLVPYNYTVCRQGAMRVCEGLGIKKDSLGTGIILVSELIGCSSSLSGAVKVNPLDPGSVAEALYGAILKSDAEKHQRHDKNYQYVISHDISYWGGRFMQVMEETCKNHFNHRYWGVGLGLGFRVISFPKDFRKLYMDQISPSYKRSTRRVILLDYDGTIVPNSFLARPPSNEVLSTLDILCSDPKNTVFIVSGRGRTSLREWFAPCDRLGIAAEHGYFTRWNEDSEWESLTADIGWKMAVEVIMNLYAETTDGAYVESKETAAVWHHQNTMADIVCTQAKDLLDQLRNIFENESVAVKRGIDIIEVRPMGVTKGTAAECILQEVGSHGKAADFVLCIGDDKSDEDMFDYILKAKSASQLTAEVFACKVGQKPSKAKYYLEDSEDVLRMLRALGTASSDPEPYHQEFRVARDFLL